MSGRSRNQKGRGKGGQGGQGGQGNPAEQQTQEPAATPQARQQQLPHRPPPTNRPPQQQQQAVPPQNLDGAPDTRGRTESPSQAGSRSGSKARAPSASRGGKKPQVAKGYDPDTRKAYDLLKNVDLGGNAYTLKSGMRAWIFATAIVLLHSCVHVFITLTCHLSPVICHISDSFYGDAAYE